MGAGLDNTAPASARPELLVESPSGDAAGNLRILIFVMTGLVPVIHESAALI
jgi:hypothetical protein